MFFSFVLSLGLQTVGAYEQVVDRPSSDFGLSINGAIFLSETRILITQYGAKSRGLQIFDTEKDQIRAIPFPLAGEHLNDLQVAPSRTAFSVRGTDDRLYIFQLSESLDREPALLLTIPDVSASRWTTSDDRIVVAQIARPASPGFRVSEWSLSDGSRTTYGELPETGLMVMKDEVSKSILAATRDSLFILSLADRRRRRDESLPSPVVHEKMGFLLIGLERSVLASPDSRTFVQASSMGMKRFVLNQKGADFSTEAITGPALRANPWPEEIALSQDGQRLLVLLNEFQLRSSPDVPRLSVYEFRSKQWVSVPQPGWGMRGLLAISPSGQSVLTSTNDRVRIFRPSAN